MLDENLGGGVSLQKNIAELPETMRPRILEARKAVERDVLLTPVLAALERGNLLQRQAVLKAFDGSFFKGRFYARQPENMIDVGNDREFGFLYEPPIELLDRTFASLLTASICLPTVAPATRSGSAASSSCPPRDRRTRRSRSSCSMRSPTRMPAVREAARRGRRERAGL